MSKAEKGAWSTEAYLMADVYHALTGHPHPARPKPDEKAAKRTRYSKLRKALEAQKARMGSTNEA